MSVMACGHNGLGGFDHFGKNATVIRKRVCDGPISSFFLNISVDTSAKCCVFITK